jgi:hypothetical protein
VWPGVPTDYATSPAPPQAPQAAAGGFAAAPGLPVPTGLEMAYTNTERKNRLPA